MCIALEGFAYSPITTTCYHNQNVPWSSMACFLADEKPRPAQLHKQWAADYSGGSISLVVNQC